uniref:Uncharacterized protein n=1 Tax=Clandestinovirus TaxID=2831644 RepID=A0A8F8KR91_9VIRU|nr:hypothetical protein KOM_12_273 [Clandestinovirus]
MSTQSNWPHGSRQRRLETQTWATETDRPKNGVIRWKDGQLFDGASVEGNVLKFAMNDGNDGLYPDDIVGVLRDLYQSFVNFNPNDHYNVKILQHLQSAIELADRRAMERHGYSGSERERTYQVSYPQIASSPQAVEFVKGASYVVEASPYESLSLYEKFLDHPQYDSKKWDSQTLGLITFVGQLGNKPVAVQLNTKIINGKKVVFYYPSGTTADWTLIEDWFDKHCNPTFNGRKCRTDASSFIHCLEHVFEL